MISNESELKDDVREMTGYKSALVLSDSGLDTAFRNAKRHIRLKRSLGLNYDWFAEENQKAVEALFWFTCLFCKVQTGELDSQGLQAGAVDANSLLAKNNNEVTTWYRNADSALSAINPSSILQSTAPSRTGRNYESATFDDQNNSGGSEANNTDL